MIFQHKKLNFLFCAPVLVTLRGAFVTFLVKNVILALQVTEAIQIIKF
jgi:hypothetical protein